jgi:pimeloyl-ACP methyl ester carboxylesterase
VTVPSGDCARLAARLWDGGSGSPAVLVVPGLGSRKENHADFAEALAERGTSAMTIDLRGHGESPGSPGPGMLADVVAGLAALAAAGHGPLGVRGSSLGGLLALHAAERHPAVRAVVALCPATPAGLSSRLGADWPLALPDLRRVGPRAGVARSLWHATGDEQVPWAGTFALAGSCPPPVRLRVVLGGGHRTLQHDPEVLAATASFMAGALETP